MLRGLGRLHIFPGDDVGAHNKLRRFFGIDTELDYDSVQRLVAPWQPYAGVVYFHLLLDSLAQTGLASEDSMGAPLALRVRDLAVGPDRRERRQLVR